MPTVAAINATACFDSPAYPLHFLAVSERAEILSGKAIPFTLSNRPSPADAGLARIAFLVAASFLLPGHFVLAVERKSAVVEVRLPADAELELNSARTRAEGQVRRFESPPLEPGSSYVYTLKATWRGRSITREVRLRPGRTTVIDLRRDLEAAAPAGSITLRVPPVVTLETGQQIFLAIHVQTESLKAPVTLSFFGLPPGLQITPSPSGSGDQNTWRGVLTAGAETEAATSTVRVHARSGKARAEVPFELVVTRTSASAVQSKDASVVCSEVTAPDRDRSTLPTCRAQKNRQPAYVRIHLPVDADVDVDGVRMPRKGETRSFESLPLQVGRSYSCPLLVTWRGWTFSRQITIHPGQEVTVDVRHELQLLATPQTPPPIQRVSAPVEEATERPILSAWEQAPPANPHRSATETLTTAPALFPPGAAEEQPMERSEPDPPATIQFVQEEEVFPVLPTEQPPKPAVSSAAAPTLPDRWLLMKTLQGTWTGATLDGERMSISGWTEVSFTASSVHDNQLPMGFNYLANQFALQQNWLRFERFVVTSGTTEPTFGFRNDWILPGIDYRFTVSRGLFSGQLTANDGEPNTYGIDPVQFYGEAYFPTIGRGLDIKIGRMFCQYGAETIDAPPNALTSHSYTFIYNPFTHTGVMGTLQITPAWSVQLGVIMGPDVFIDPAASPYSMFSIKWAPPGGRDSVLFSGLLGSGRFNESRQFNNPNILDVVCIHTFNSVLTYTLDSLFGYQTNVPDIGTATWFTAANYLTYKISPRLSGTTRLEFFDDIDGNRTGFEGLYTALAVGLNFQPRKDIIFRPEIRYDHNFETRPFQDHHGVFTATTDVIVRW